MNADEVRKLIAAQGAHRKERKESDDLPEKADLEAVVEKTTKCAKCKGKVRAVIENAEPGDGIYCDADFLVSIYCPAKGCDWKVTQWRPWKKSRPKVL